MTSAVASRRQVGSRPGLQALLQRGGERVARISRCAPMRPLVRRAIQTALPRRFDPRQAQDLITTLELRLREPDGTIRPLTLEIDRGRLTLAAGSASQPAAVAEVPVEDVIRLAVGAVGWPALISRGRMLMTGDPFLALRFPALFRLPV